MAGVVEFVLKARDEATREIQRVSGALGGMSGMVGRLTSTMGTLGIASVSLTAVAAGALAAAKGIGDFAETLDRQARSAGTSTANMQALKLAFEQAGLSGDDASKALAKLNREIDAGNPMLAEMGVTSRDAFTAFVQLGQTLGTMSDEARKGAVVHALLGRSMSENAGIVDSLAASTKANVEQLARYGATMDEVATAKALKLDTALDDVDFKLKASATSLGKHFTPALLAMAEAANKALDGLAGLWGQLDKLEKKTGGGWVGKAARLGPLGIAASPFLLWQQLMGGGGEEGAPGMMSAHGPEAAGIESTAAPGAPSIPRFGTGGKRVAARSMDKSMAEAAERFHERLENIVSVMDEAETPMLRLTEAGMQAWERLEAIGAAFDNMQSAIAGSIGGAVDAVIRGTMSIGQAFRSLMQDILASVATSLAKLGIGLGLQALGWAIGGPVGKFVAGVGGRVASSSMAPAGGGDTYVIQTLDAKTLTDSIVAPTGQWRQATSRIREVALAGTV